MNINKIQIGDKKVFPFTIPSGIITTESSSIESIANKIEEIGILTTKSIGPESRKGNREPILAQYYPGCFINAVGLTNPGAKKFAENISKISFPKDKFLLASIFGKDTWEFVYVAQTLEDLVDGFELNLSCPHAKGYGMQLGQDLDIVYKITKMITSRTKKPVFAKLTPNVNNIVDIANSAINAGAYGITAINTVGPKYWSVDGNPILTNNVGGISGRGILPFGLSAIKDITQKLGNIPIIGMGGIASARDIKEYASAGASYFGVGSALAGMDEKEINIYFKTLVKDLQEDTNNAENLLKLVDMEYKKFKVADKIDLACNFKIIKTNNSLMSEPGQFIFAFIPGLGEKPFSILDDEPLALGVLERGDFTNKLNSLNKGDAIYIRGPYGKNIGMPSNLDITLVGGGCGLAGLYLFAKKLHEKNKITTLLAAKDKDHIPYLKEFEIYSKVYVATEDGSLGTKGLITDLFKKADIYSNCYFFNCGPKSMIDAVLPLELNISRSNVIYSSMDYMTRCGVGICGSCADKSGLRTCVEGPFMSY